MNVKNRYYFRSRIREAEFRQLIRCFALDFTATSAAQLTDISIRSVNAIYLKVRQRIAQCCELESPLQGAAVEVDESYFGPRSVSGACRAGYCVHSDGWRGYDGLVDIGFDKHFRVHHGNNDLVSGERHINGIESFWSFAKRRLAKFNGIPEHTFYLHLKETEFRFNHRRDNLYYAILILLRSNPL